MKRIRITTHHIAVLFVVCLLTVAVSLLLGPALDRAANGQEAPPPTTCNAEGACVMTSDLEQPYTYTTTKPAQPVPPPACEQQHAGDGTCPPYAG